MLSSQELKKDFPILSRKINGKELVYLDSAATSQKPDMVIESISNYYRQSNANVHRGAHTLANEATDIYEKARKDVAQFLSTGGAEEIVFVRNTTEAINLVSYSWGEQNIKVGDVVLCGVWEHHSNFVPWQRLCARKGAVFQVVPLDKYGNFDLALLKERFSDKVKLLVMCHASNVLGIIFPVEEVAREIKNISPDAKVLVDGAQAVPHIPVSLKNTAIDFYAFSGHKALGPMGIGVLWAKASLLADMEPFLSGGGMIEEVFVDRSTWAEPPMRFEAGTPDVSAAAGLSASINYLTKLGMKNVRAHEELLAEQALAMFLELKASIPGLRILGPLNAKNRTALVAFIIDGIHSHDIGAVLDSEGIAVRAGFHCTMPLHHSLQIGPSVRASAYIYNTPDDFAKLRNGIIKAHKILS